LEDSIVATSKASSNSDETVSEIHIAAPPEQVFQALVDPERVVQWWGQEGVYECREFVSDLRAGGKWKTAGIGPDGTRFEVKGEYLEVNPPYALAYTWIASWTGETQTTVRWELEPANQGTFVRIRHSGFAAHPELVESYRGWPRMLGWLRALLETGETVESRKPASWS
jgi:uncharacterized protein YndB with AHSA1/START domain